MKKDKPIWIDEQKYYLAFVLLCIFLTIPLIGYKSKAVMFTGLIFMIFFYLLFFNYVLPVKLYSNRIRVARYRKWILFPRTDVYFKDIERIQIRNFDKTGIKGIGSTIGAGSASGLIFLLIIEDVRGVKYLNTIFDRKAFKNKLKEMHPSVDLT